MGKKGRDRRLIERRNRKVVERYYYWTEVRRLRFDDAVKQLAENEFFLSEFMIWQILRKTPQAPDELKQKKPHKASRTTTEEQLSLFPDEEKSSQ